MKTLKSGPVEPAEPLQSVGVLVPDDTPKKGNCGVTACAVMAGVSFREAWEAFFLFTPKGATWKGSTRTPEQLKVLDHFGVRLEEIRVPYAQMMIKTFAKRYADPTEMYMIGTGSHAQVLFRERFFDQNTAREGAHYDSYWGKSKYVNRIWRRMHSHEKTMPSLISDDELEAAFKKVEKVTGKRLTEKSREGWVQLAKTLPARPKKLKNLLAKAANKGGQPFATEFEEALNTLAQS